jgi:hypothetical protein
MLTSLTAPGVSAKIFDASIPPCSTGYPYTVPVSIVAPDGNGVIDAGFFMFAIVRCNVTPFGQVDGSQRSVILTVDTLLSE